MLAVCVDVPGGPENLRVGTVPKPRPKDGEVLIKVHATALNRADILQVAYNIYYVPIETQRNENSISTQ